MNISSVSAATSSLLAQQLLQQNQANLNAQTAGTAAAGHVRHRQDSDGDSDGSTAGGASSSGNSASLQTSGSQSVLNTVA